MPLRIAHRGASAEHPENTLPAIRRALELGADGIEIDVHATRDGIVVVHHDPEVRLPSGDRLPIAATPHRALAAAEPAPGLSMPTLAEVLALVGGRATLYVELKGAAMEDVVVAALRAAPAASVALHSFDHAAIGRLAAKAPAIPRGLLFERPPEDPVGAMRAAAARDLWAERAIVDAGLVERVQAAGGRLIVWTVNDPDEAVALASMGVDALCGDDLRLLPANRVRPGAAGPVS